MIEIIAKKKRVI